MENAKHQRKVMVRLTPKQFTRYRRAARKSGYRQLSPWIRAMLDAATAEPAVLDIPPAAA